MNTNKSGVRALVSLCVAHGVRQVIISPGSRNAPITIAFENHPEIKTYSIVDERSAGFVALGMALKTKEPTAVVCTSGSALLNYAPAVVEAFYQHIPLVVISADRPNEFINQGLGQSIEQHNLLSSIVKKSVSLPNIIVDNNQQWYCERLINEALLAAKTGKTGPVHINVPLSEPLYELTSEPFENPKHIKYSSVAKAQWSIPEVERFQKTLILVGQNQIGQELNDILSELSKQSNIQIWTEATSNVAHPNFIDGIDKLLASFSINDTLLFAPELLITIGDAIVSKRIKSYLQQVNNFEHWQIGQSPEVVDTYKHLTHIFEGNEIEWLLSFKNQLPKNSNSTYQSIGLTQKQQLEKAHNTYCEAADYSDFSVYDAICKALLNNDIDIHVANSAAIRYMQLFERSASQTYYCNRGTSGIDGSTSTAVGAAMVTEKPVWFLTGDISFLYDSNAFWNEKLPKNLKVVIVNNHGGGIFRLIDGPNKTKVLDQYLETHHQLDAANICAQHKVAYQIAQNIEEVNNGIAWLQEQESTAVLEIFTPRLLNSDILKDYFKYIKNYTYGNN
jgi:2-succinyl-5-enolpyruvyl-6-hydroxy-3-cyclohexene-1-carboxylate synthase